MTPEMKKKLLTRKFSSIEYMEELEHYWEKSVQGLVECLRYFDRHCQHIDMSTWQPAEKPEAWRDRALPNFKGILFSIREGIDNAKIGKTSTIRAATGSMQGLSKDMDVLGNKWWFCIDEDLARKQGTDQTKAEQIASNIWHTIGEYFEDGEIVDEEITGLIDEQDLLRYLQPGEQV